MATPSESAVEFVLASALQRILGGRAVGWSFVLRDQLGELAAIGEGYARAPWEPTAPGLVMTPDSRSQIASMSKTVTAVGLFAVMDDWNRMLTAVAALISRLRQQYGAPATLDARGLLAALGADTLSQVLSASPQFVNRVLGDGQRLTADRALVDVLKARVGTQYGLGVDQILLKHLLTHQSGIDFSGVECTNDTDDNLFDVWPCVKLYLQRPTKWTPGNGQPGYHNNHFRILRAVVEDTSTEEYQSFLMRRVFGPIGSFSMSCAPDADRPTMYYGNDPVADPGAIAAGRPGTTFGAYRNRAGGFGWFGSMRDYARFLRAFDARQILPMAARNEMTTNGYGFYGEVHSDGQWFGHNGAWSDGRGGMNASSRILPHNRAAALVINSTNIDADGVMRQALDALLPAFEIIAPQFVVPRVRLRNPIGFGDIRMNTNGALPSPTATVAADPLFLEANAQVRACVFEGNRWLGRDGGFDIAVDLTQRRPSDAPSGGGGAQGLDYRYVEAEYDKLPDFNLLPAASVSAGTAAAPDLSQRARDDNFAIEYRALLDVMGAGTYYFGLNSDDGSRLWIGDTLVIDNDGGHSPQRINGGIALAAGRHLCRIQYFQKGGGRTLELFWRPPGMPESIVPSNRYFRPGATALSATPTRARGGLRWRLVHGSFERFPEGFAGMMPMASGVSSTIGLPPRHRNRDYAVEFTGWFEAVTAGDHTFELSSDDGSRLFIDDSLVVDNDGLHATVMVAGTKSLTTGLHAIRVQFHQAGWGEALDLKFRIGAAVPLQSIPPRQLWYW